MDTKDASITITTGNVENSTVTLGEGNTVLAVKITSSASTLDFDAVSIQKELDAVVKEMKKTAETDAQDKTLTEALLAKEAMQNNDKNKAIKHMKNCGKWLLDVSKQVGAQMIVDLIT